MSVLLDDAVIPVDCRPTNPPFQVERDPVEIVYSTGTPAEARLGSAEAYDILRVGLVGHSDCAGGYIPNRPESECPSVWDRFGSNSPETLGHGR